MKFIYNNNFYSSFFFVAAVVTVKEEHTVESEWEPGAHTKHKEDEKYAKPLWKMNVHHNLKIEKTLC